MLALADDPFARPCAGRAPDTAARPAGRSLLPAAAAALTNAAPRTYESAAGPLGSWEAAGPGPRCGLPRNSSSEVEKTS